jgi:Ca2+-binding RTX toxin-like protein
VLGGDGTDTLYGDDGNDTLLGEDGADILYGGSGDDYLDVGGDSLGNWDYAIGGSGSDTFIYKASYILASFSDNSAEVNSDIIIFEDLNIADVTFTFTQSGGSNYVHVYHQYEGVQHQARIQDYSQIETLRFGNFDIYNLNYNMPTSGTQSGTTYSDYLTGENGNDTINGGDGSDLIYGGSGNDILDGWNGNDYINGEEGDDNIEGRVGDDIIAGGAGSDTLSGGYDNDIIFGDAGTDLVYGDDGADTLYGGDGADSLYGGSGNDYLEGQQGNDILIGGLGADRFVFNDNFGHDTINDFDNDDTIEFASSLFVDFNAVIAAATDDGLDTTIAFDASNSLVVKDILVSELQSDDFRFLA